MTSTPDDESSVSKLGGDVVQAGPWLMVQVSGELDLATAPGLLTQVGGLITMVDSPQVALEMSGVTFCDSSGINALVRLWKRISTVSGELMVLRPRARWRIWGRGHIRPTIPANTPAADRCLAR